MSRDWDEDVTSESDRGGNVGSGDRSRGSSGMDRSSGSDLGRSDQDRDRGSSSGNSRSGGKDRGGY
jgi:hypothetical protein